VGQHRASRNRYTTLRDSLTTNTSGRYSSECTIHLERTLDEAYFPGLGTDELASRNADQIVSSKFRDIADFPEEDVPILAVPQLWLWRFGNCIISAHSMTPRSSRRFDPSGDLRSHYFESHSHHLRQPNIDVQLGLIITDFIAEFGKETIHNDRKIPPALDLFESRVVSVLSDVKKYIKETRRNDIDYNSEANFLHVLSDCRSELAMIQHILAQQEEVLVGLLDDRRQTTSAKPAVQPDLSPTPLNVPHDEEESHPDAVKPDSSPTPPITSHNNEESNQPPVKAGSSPTPPITSHNNEESDQPPVKADWGPVEKAHAMLKQYQKRIKKIDGDAQRIEKNVQDLLNLKRTYASVQDSHAGVLLSVAAIGFAIVTVIFAPLAFLVGLFAINLQGFDRLRVKQGNSEESSVVNIVNGVGDGRDLTVNVDSNNDPAFHSGKMAGIFSKCLFARSIGDKDEINVY
jgi:hypothetical protein